MGIEQIERIGVIGAGVMGSEIAQVAAAAGCTTVMVDIDDAAVIRGMAHIRSIGERRVARGRLTQEQADEITGRVGVSVSLDALGDCDLIIEAGPEVLELKLELWRASTRSQNLRRCWRPTHPGSPSRPSPASPAARSR